MLNKIMNYTIKNNGGTFNRDGKPVMFIDGYQVSKKDICILHDVNNASLVDFNAILDSLADNEYLGTWVDNNKLYIDISIHVKKQDKAIKLGKLYNQLAILEWSTMDSITVK